MKLPKHTVPTVSRGTSGIIETHGLNVMDFTDYIELSPLKDAMRSTRDCFIEVPNSGLLNLASALLTGREAFWIIFSKYEHGIPEMSIVRESDIRGYLRNTISEEELDVGFNPEHLKSDSFTWEIEDVTIHAQKLTPDAFQSSWHETKPFYFTCGAGHEHLCRNGKVWNTESVICIRAKDEYAARDFVMDTFGREWCAYYYRFSEVSQFTPNGIAWEITI